MSDNQPSVESLTRKLQSATETLAQLRYQHEMMLRWVEESALLVVDRQGIISDATDAALRSLHWKRGDFIGLNFHSTVQHTLDDGNEYPWEFSPVFAAIEDGSTHHVNGEIYWTSEKDQFSVDYIVCSNRNETNEIIGATITFRNLSEKRLQDAKRIHGMKLESIGQLSAGIAHEINTPMQFIATNLDFLKESFDQIQELVDRYKEVRTILESEGKFQDLCQKLADKEEEIDLGYLEEEVPTAFEQTCDGVECVVKLVQGLKGFAHSDNSETKHLADLNEIIHNSLLVCRNEYKYVAELETDLKEIPTINLHRGDIGQVVVNLIVNAAHAISDHQQDGQGNIFVRSWQNDKGALFSIQDNGKGIPEEVRSKIFDPFFTTKEVGKGSGQGLAISRNIVEKKHGGTMSFSTEPGVGTTFTVQLPFS